MNNLVLIRACLSWTPDSVSPKPGNFCILILAECIAFPAGTQAWNHTVTFDPTLAQASHVLLVSRLW